MLVADRYRIGTAGGRESWAELGCPRGRSRGDEDRGEGGRDRRPSRRLTSILECAANLLVARLFSGMRDRHSTVDVVQLASRDERRHADHLEKEIFLRDVCL